MGTATVLSRKRGGFVFLDADGDALFEHGLRRLQSGTGKRILLGLYLLPCWYEDADEPVHARRASIASGFQDGLLIASVPLTDGEWWPFAEGEIVAVSAGKVIDSMMP